MHRTKLVSFIDVFSTPSLSFVKIQGDWDILHTSYLFKRKKLGLCRKYAAEHRSDSVRLLKLN